MPDNANPTILSNSQLPSRQHKRYADRGPETKYDRVIFSSIKNASPWPSDDEDQEDLADEPIDEQEIYDLISTISDPEHPHTLGQLSVVNLPDIRISPSRPERSGPDDLVTVLVEITPTITHCSLATVIGLAVRVRLEEVLPPNHRVDVRMKDGSHQQDDQVNKQLADKERVAAALENDTLTSVLNNMLLTCA